jgi:hypothetical protein
MRLNVAIDTTEPNVALDTTKFDEMLDIVEPDV